MATGLEQFAQALAQSGLMTPAEIAAFIAALETPPRDGDELLELLVKRRRTTAYQAHAVRSGELKRLVFGEYTVLEKIGQGSESIVLKAQHRRMKRLVAIKVLTSRAMRSRQSIERFFREAEAAARLSHPNIIAAYDASQCDGMDYLVMEYVDGQDLSTIVKEHGPLPLDQAVDWILQAARGLQYAHEEGIVHRDIKPANLLLDHRGVIKILDMGLARLPTLPELTDEGEQQLTQVGQVMGTCDYMAPEQTLDSHQVDGRADIYSLGCTLYRVLAGYGPYTAKSFIGMFLAHRESPIPSLCAARPDAPPELDAAFGAMVAKRPDDRFRSMFDVIMALDACLKIVHDRTPRAVSAAAAAPGYPDPVTHHALLTAEETLRHGKHDPDSHTSAGVGAEEPRSLHSAAIP